MELTFAEVLSLIETIVLTLTLLVVGFYTRETYKLRQATQKQAEHLISEIDPTFVVSGFGESVHQDRAHMRVRAVGGSITNLQAESLDGYEVSVSRKSLFEDEDLFVIIFEGADQKSIQQASLLLRFTNAIGVQREKRYRVNGKRLQAIAA